MDLGDAQKIGKLINDLDKHIRTGNKELGLQTLGMMRDALGNRIAQESIDKNLRAYEEAQRRFNEAKPAPASIGGFEAVVLEEEPVIRRGRPRKVEVSGE